MSDIVERLRTQDIYDYDDAVKLCCEAAAEIERLQLILKNVQEARVLQGKAILDANNEIDRLRAALRECEAELDDYYRAEYPGDHPYSQKKLQQAMASNPARAALTQPAQSRETDWGNPVGKEEL